MWAGHAAPEHPGHLSSCPGPPPWLQCQRPRWPRHAPQGPENADPERGRHCGPRSNSPVGASLSRLRVHGRVPEHPVRSRTRPGHPCMTQQLGCEASMVSDHFTDMGPGAGDAEQWARPRAVAGSLEGCGSGIRRTRGTGQDRTGQDGPSRASGAAPCRPCPPAGWPRSTRAASWPSCAMLGETANADMLPGSRPCGSDRWKDRATSLPVSVPCSLNRSGRENRSHGAVWLR